jgi:2-polyprenyl-3-methyl-5-hydroxy-6-metoxy-1,4-benzoquinol methylase
VKHITNSPITNSELKPFLTCKDYTVSGEFFTILKDEKSGLLVTSPRPEDKDLGHFYESEDYISHTDAKASFTEKLYQIVRKYTLKRKLRLIDSFQQEEKSLLDIGCGTGDFLHYCKQHGWKVDGVEPNSKAKKITEEKVGLHLKGRIEEINAQYDVITMWHVLEHVPNLLEYIAKLKLLLKENGVLIVAVPNHKSYDATYYKEWWAAYDVPRHLWHFSKKSISVLFGKAEMKIEKIVPMYFDSFYVSLLSEKYKTGSSNFIKAFFIGLLSNLKAISTKEYSSLIYIIKNSKNSF